MVNGVFQVEDAIFDGVADIVLWVGSRGGHLLIGTAFCKLLMLQQIKGEEGRQSETLYYQNTVYKASIHNFSSKRNCTKRSNDFSWLHVVPDLDEDLPLELVGWGQAICRNIHRLSQQHVSKHLLKGSGHIPLLHNTTMVLNGQDDGIPVGGVQKFFLYLCLMVVWLSYLIFLHTLKWWLMSL